MTDGPRVGFIGLGNMGRPMARNLRTAGFDLVAYDAAPDVLEAFVAEFGGTAANGPEDFAGCGVVVTMLPNDRIVAAVVLEWEGGLGAHLGSGAVLVDMSSSSPGGVRAIAEALAAYGVDVVDAPVSGGVPRAESGELSLMVGGEDDAVARATPVLEVLGAKIFRTGGLGTGDTVKALNNYLAAAGYAAATEALHIGEHFGVDPATLFEIVNTSTGRSFVTEIVVGGNVVTGAYATGFQLALLAKDVGIAAGLGEESGIDAPVLELTNARWQAAAAGAAPGTDHSAAQLQWWPAEVSA